MKTTHSTSPGFTLIELMVSLTIVIILCAVLGLGLSQNRRPIDKQKTRLAARIEQNQFESHLLRYLPWAVAFEELTASSITWTCQDPAVTAQNLKSMTYQWDASACHLLFTEGNDSPVILADNLADFSISWKLDAQSLPAQMVRQIQIDYKTQAAPEINHQIIIPTANLPEK